MNTTVVTSEEHLTLTGIICKGSAETDPAQGCQTVFHNQEHIVPAEIYLAGRFAPQEQIVQVSLFDR